jgi:hypothetical protein
MAPIRSAVDQADGVDQAGRRRRTSSTSLGGGGDDRVRHMRRRIRIHQAMQRMSQVRAHGPSARGAGHQAAKMSGEQVCGAHHRRAQAAEEMTGWYGAGWTRTVLVSRL